MAIDGYSIMAISGYSIMAIGGYSIMAISDYSVVSHRWLFYFWLLMAILLMVINGYCIINY